MNWAGGVALPLNSACLRALAARADGLSTRHTAVLEGAFGSSIRPGTLARECFHATLGGAEHRVFDLATGVGDEQVKLGGGGNVEHGVMVVDVASIQGQGSSCNHLQPGDGFARGEAPDDHGGPAVIDRPIEGDVPSGVQIGGELSTVLIEGAEGLGLNGEGHEVRSFDL